MSDGLQDYLNNIKKLCVQAHNSIHQIYFDYPMESALVQ